MKAYDGYDCFYTPEPITIDGTLNDPAWQKAQVITDFLVPVTNEEALSKTEARLLWDSKYLYAGFRAYDKDIWSYFTERDDPTCMEDVLELSQDQGPV